MNFRQRVEDLAFIGCEVKLINLKKELVHQIETAARLGNFSFKKVIPANLAEFIARWLREEGFKVRISDSSEFYIKWRPPQKTMDHLYTRFKEADTTRTDKAGSTSIPMPTPLINPEPNPFFNSTPDDDLSKYVLRRTENMLGD